MTFYALIDCSYKKLTQTLQAWILGDKHGLNLLDSFFKFFEWFHFKWPVNSGGWQYKQVFGIQCNHNGRIEVKMIVFKEKSFQSFDNWPPNTGCMLNTGCLIQLQL